MDETQPTKPTRTAVFILVCSVATVSWMLVDYSRIARDIFSYRSVDWLAVLLSPFVLLGATLLLRWRPRLGYATAIVGAALPLPWILMTESRAVGNSWIALNASWNDSETFHYTHYAQLRIASVVLLLMTLVWAITRLLPSNLLLRGRPLNQRTWPAIAVTLILTVGWFVKFASPYREPVIVDGVHPELSILNVRKDGAKLHETRISIYRDGQFYIVRSERQLLRYSFEETAQKGLLTDDLRAKLKDVKAIPELMRTLDKPPRALRAWHGEGWYTETNTFAITAFTTENRTPPPADLVSFFLEVERAPSIGETAHDEVRDVCLGFCYDPKAGLGDRAENERCAYGADGKERCY
jgi:hypothetical protein